MDNFAQLHWKFVSFNILWNWLLVSICILYECCVSIVYENNLFVSWKTCWFQAISHNTLPLPLPIINCKFCWWHSTKIAFHDTLRFKCTHINSQFFIPFVEIYPNVYVEIKQQKKREKKTQYDKNPTHANIRCIDVEPIYSYPKSRAFLLYQ